MKKKTIATNTSIFITINTINRLKKDRAYFNDVITKLKYDRRKLIEAYKVMTRVLNTHGNKTDQYTESSCEENIEVITELRGEITLLRRKHECEKNIMSLRHFLKENELKREISILNKYYDHEDHSYTDSSASISGIVSNEKKSMTDMGSSELAALREEVKKVKKDHEIKLQEKDLS